MLDVMGAKDGALVGRVLGRSYEVVRRIGAGGMGTVYEARGARLRQTRFAIKVLRQGLDLDDSAYARFQREAEIISRLGHPHIVTVLDFDSTAEGMPFMVMELLQGEDLGALLKREGKLPLDRAAAIFSELGSALQAAHDQGVVHRDIKPQNIFLCRHGARADYPKLLDFGISKLADAEVQLTGSQACMGTPSYMAPEAAWGESAQADVRGDIFSLGSVLYLALTGVEPFPGNNIVAVIHAVVNTEPDPVSRRNSALPEEVSRVVERAMAKDPAQRFSSMAELAAALGEAAGEPVGPDPCSWAVETVLEDHGGEAPVMKNTDLADTRPSAAESGGTAVTLLEGQPSAERPPLADPDIRSRIGRLSGVALVLILLLGGGGLLWLVLGEKDTPTVSDLASRDGLTGVRDSGPGLEPSASGPLKQSLGTISGEVIGCYTEAIKGRAQLQGKLRFKLVFGDGGELKDVSPVEDSVGSPALAACIVTQLKKLPRQPTMAGKVVRVPYQFATARKVALLPFENLAHADELDWLRGGMVESLSAKLGQISSVVLVDRAKLRAGLAGSGQKGGQEQGIHAAHEAGATLVIMGAFQRLAGRCVSPPG